MDLVIEMLRLLKHVSLSGFDLANLTHNPCLSLPAKPFFPYQVHCSVDFAVAGSCLQMPFQRHSLQMYYFATNYLSFPDLDLKKFHALMAEIHRCYQSVAECSPRVADCLDHSHLIQLKSETPLRTYPREAAATAAEFGVNLVEKVEIAAAANFAVCFAGPVVVPKLLGQGFVVVFVECLREKEILCDVTVSFAKTVRDFWSPEKHFPMVCGVDVSLTRGREELQVETRQHFVRKSLFHYSHPYFVVARFASLVPLPLAFQRHPSLIHFLRKYCISS